MRKTFQILVIHLCLLSGLQAQQSGLVNLAEYVNPFIGTTGGGNTFPGASLPFGMVKLGPDCGNKRANMGYLLNSEIHGFSHVHVSGTGGGAKYGNILVMPLTGDINLKNYKSPPGNEKASPGYFSVNFKKYDIKAEMTVSHSAGFHKYVFPESDKANILIDAGSFLGEGHCCGEAQELVGSEIEILSNTQIEGYTRVRGGWNKGGVYTVYFSAVFDTAAESYGIWKSGEIKESGKLAYDSGERTGAYFSFKTGKKQVIQVKVGISFISRGKARMNLQREIPHWNFSKTHKEAITAWNEVLNSILVEGTTKQMDTIFYTALYHTMLMPTDRTSENSKWLSNEPYYDDYYAIWDTYRATHPLFTLIQPQRERDMVRSLIDIYRFEGYMPDSRSGNYTGRTQGGSNCDMVIVDAYLKGLEGIDYETAYAAMIKNAEIPPGGNQQSMGRGGINEYVKLGYVPSEYEPEDKHPDLHIPKLYERAGSRTLEYSANDYAIALMAQRLKKEKDYIKFKKRSGNWANLWKQTKSHGTSGFIWPKRKDGSWLVGYSPFESGSWGNFLYEANSWEYSFYVPHDVKALIDSCGGREAFISRLDTFFINDYYQVSNEPSFLTPCLYIYAGRQDKTNKQVREIIRNYYKPTRSGIPGNDDAGSMSAWLVFHAMGIYPNAGQDVYLITAPHFKKVVSHIGKGKQLIIKANNLSKKNIYIKSAKLNGKTLDRAWFRHHEIKNGGILEFTMDNKPSSWGSKYPPPSLSDE